MSEHYNEDRLDGELRRAIDTTSPQFDAEAWKRKYAKEYQTLIARGRRRTDSGSKVRSIVGRLAIAAVILIGVSLLVMRLPERESQGPKLVLRPIAPSPARILSMMSLRTAYQQGGQEALDQQLDVALTTLGPRPGQVTALEVFDDLEG